MQELAEQVINHKISAAHAFKLVSWPHRSQRKRQRPAPPVVIEIPARRKPK
jgi:hypothetical protein